MRELFVVVLIGLVLTLTTLVFQTQWVWTLAERVMPY